MAGDVVERGESDQRRRSGFAPWARLALGLLILLGAVAVAIILIATRPTPKLAPTAQLALTVRTVDATPKPVSRVWNGYGAARALHAADVAAQVAGVVTERPHLIDAGRWIERGDLILQIDDAEFRHRADAATEAIAALRSQRESLDVEQVALNRSVELAEQAIDLSERELSRARDAQARGAATQNEIERLMRELTALQRETSELRRRRDQIPIRQQEIDAQIRQQRAAADVAQLDVQRAHVTSPISGVLQLVAADEGDWVAAGQAIARIVDLRRIEVPIRMPISAGADLRPGDPITLVADGPSELRWIGEITRIAPEADAGSRSVTMFAEIEQEAREATRDTLLPGQFLIGRAGSRRTAPLIVAPRSAIIDDRVMIVNADGRAESRRISVAFFLDERFNDLDPQITQWAAIRDGLEPGDRIIISNLDEIEDGVKVEVSNGATRAPTAQRPDTEQPRSASQ